jgi:hypothetical protein
MPFDTTNEDSKRTAMTLRTKALADIALFPWQMSLAASPIFFNDS